MLRVFGLLGVLATGCGSSKKATTTPTGPATVATQAPKRPVEIRTEERPAASPETTSGQFAPIYFDYDTAALKPEARATLQSIAEYLRRTPGATLTIAGHADERGTPEYNLALGEERAKAARDYLVRLGIEANRIQIISYGEERPVATGSDEESWARNRRDEFDIRVTPSKHSR